MYFVTKTVSLLNTSSWKLLQGIRNKKKKDVPVHTFNSIQHGKIVCVCVFVEDKIVESLNVSAKSQFKNNISIRVCVCVSNAQDTWLMLLYFVLDIWKWPNDLGCCLLLCKQISFNVILARVIVVVVVFFLLAWLMSGVCVCVCVCVLCSKLLFLWSLH